MSTDNCKIGNNIVAASILLANPKLTKEIDKIAANIDALNIKLASASKEQIELIKRDIDFANMDLDALVASNVLRGDFGVQQQAALLKRFKRRGGSLQEGIELLESINDLPKVASVDEITGIMNNLGIGEDAIATYQTSFESLRQGLIKKIVMDDKFLKRYKFAKQQLDDLVDSSIEQTKKQTKEEPLYKQYESLMTNPESEEAVRNYIVAKSFFSPDRDVNITQLKKLISGKKYANISVNDIMDLPNDTAGLKELEKMVFLYTPLLKKDDLVEAVVEKLNIIKTGLSPADAKKLGWIEEFGATMDDVQGLKKFMSEKSTKERLLKQGYKTNLTGKQIRDDVVDLLNGRREGITWNVKKLVNGKWIEDTVTISEDNMHEAIRLLGVDQLEKVGISRDVMNAILKLDSTVGDEVAQQGIKNTVEENEKLLKDVIKWFKKTKPNFVSGSLTTRLLSSVSNANVDSLKYATIFNPKAGTSALLKDTTPDGFAVGEAIMKKHSLPIGGKASLSKTDKQLEEEILSLIKKRDKGEESIIVFLPTSREEKAVYQLKKKYRSKNVQFISPKGKLDYNFFIDDTGNLFLGAKDIEKLAEVYEEFQTVGDKIELTNFGITDAIIVDYNNKANLKRFGKNEKTYTKLLAEKMGNMSAAEAKSTLRALTNGTQYTSEFVDNDVLWKSIKTMNASQTQGEIDIIASVKGIELGKGNKIKLGEETLKDAQRALFTFKYTPQLGEGIDSTLAVTTKRDALNELLSLGGYKGPVDVSDYYVLGEFNNVLYEKGFVVPYDGGRGFIESMQAGKSLGNNNFVNAFIGKYKNTPEFIALPGRGVTTNELNSSKAMGVLSSAFETSRSGLGKSKGKLTKFIIPEGRGFALVDNTADLHVLKGQIADYFEGQATKKGVTKPDFLKMKETRDSILDGYLNDMGKAISDGDDFDAIDAIKNKYQAMLDEFEDEVVMKELGHLFNSSEISTYLRGTKYDIYSVYEQSQLTDLTIKVGKIKEQFKNVEDEVSDRLKAKAEGTLTEKYGVISAVDGDRKIGIDIADARERVRGLLPDGIPTKDIDYDQIKSLPMAEQKLIYAYEKAVVGLKGKIDGVEKMFYESIGELIRSKRFFENYKLVDTVYGPMPKVVYNSIIADARVGLQFFSPYEAAVKKDVYDKIMNYMKTTGWSPDMSQNRFTIKSIIKDSIDGVIKNEDIKQTQEVIDRLINGYDDLFNVYSELVPLDSKMVKAIQDRLPEVPESLSDIIIPTTQSSASSIKTIPETGMGRYLGGETPPSVDYTDFIPQEEIDRMNKSFNDSFGFEMDNVKVVDELQTEINASLFNTARSQYNRYARTNAIATFTDTVRGQSIGSNLQFSLGYISQKSDRFSVGINWRELNELRGKKQSEFGMNKKLLEGAQKELVDGDYMGMTDDMFDSIGNRNDMSYEQVIAYDVAKYFRTMRDVFNLSEDGSTGIVRSSGLNRDLYNLYNSFLNIGKNPDEFVKDFYIFSNATNRGEIFKLGLKSGAKDEFFAKYAKLIKNTTMGDSYSAGEITDEFVKDFNKLFDGAFAKNEVMTMASHMFGFKITNMLENWTTRKLGSLWDLFLLPPLKAVARVGWNVLTSASQIPSWYLRNQAIKYGVSADELAEIRKFRHNNDVLGELADVSDLYTRSGVDKVMKEGGFSSADDASLLRSKTGKGLLGIFKRGKGETTLRRGLSQGNNLQEFIASARTKDIALYRAIQENPVRPFATVSEFTDFMAEATVQEKNKVMNAIGTYANKTYNDVMGMGFGAIDEAVGVTGAQQIGKMLYWTQSYMSGWGANVMKTLFDNVNKLFNAKGYVARNGYSAESINVAYDYIRNSRQFKDMATTMMHDLRNMIYLARFQRTGGEQEDNDTITLEDLLFSLGVVSSTFQAANVMFKPVFAGIDSATDARAREQEGNPLARSDYYGLGGFTRSLVMNTFRQMKFAEAQLAMLEGFANNGIGGARESLGESFLNAADGTLKFMVGGDASERGLQTERHSPGFLQNILAQKNNQNQDMMYMFQSMNDATWNLMMAGNHIGAILHNIKSNKAWNFTTRSGKLVNLGLKGLGLFSDDEDFKSALNEFGLSLNEQVEKIQSTDGWKQYSDSGMLRAQNSIDRDELIKEYVIADGIGTSKVLDGLKNFLITGSYVYDGPEYWVKPVYKSLLESIPEENVQAIYDALSQETSAAKRKSGSIELFNNEIEKLRASGADNGRYIEWKAMLSGASLSLGYDAAEDGKKLSPADKEAQKALYIAQIESILPQLNKDAYVNYVTRKIARDNSQDEDMKQIMIWDENKNKYKHSSIIRNELLKSVKFKDHLDEGDVDAAMAVYSPLSKKFGGWDNEEKTAFIGWVTQATHYIDSINTLTEEKKLKAKAEMLGPVIGQVQESFDALIEANPEFNQVYEAFAGTMYNVENDFTDFFRDKSETGSGGGASAKKFVGVKYDISKFIDKYRDQARDARHGLLGSPGKYKGNEISPMMMELIKTETPPKLNAKLEGLTLKALPQITDKDISRKVKARKTKAFKLPK